ncbi:hypothetical protein P3X46_006087 [Hevea brasiliensis]|uniref:Peptidase A1 domain-containing protein n=1 Tax=Hevea brasiliensis TaxID=3981 RepID=A0ABQ9MP30_HEVBR|nr:hypothetical protein P3X46_006087 [Hevea brasiliensis]
MASSLQFILLSLLVFFYLSHAQTSSSNSKPKALVLPIYKDASTLQYLTHLNLGTPSLQTTLVVDLGGRHLWVDCSSGYHSSTYRPGHCGSASCSLAKAECGSICPSPAKPGCKNNTCTVLAKNSVFGGYLIPEVAIDTISPRSTDGSKAGSYVSIPNFIFALSSAFGGSFCRKFAICLPSNPKAKWCLVFGDSPYQFHPGYDTSKVVDVSSSFRYTKLVNYETTASPRLQGAQLPEYFVKITSILVNQKPVPINSTLLDFHKTGIGGSRITTVQPYTTLETSIYKSFVKVFDEQMLIVRKEDLDMSLLGFSVPDIYLVFGNRDVNWSITGANSIVEVSNDVVCLGFLDRGPNTGLTTTSIDVGAHQLQDNLLQFDVAASRLAFTSSLLLQEVECSNFKF